MKVNIYQLNNDYCVFSLFISRGGQNYIAPLCKNGLKPETFIEIEVVLEQRDIVLYYLFDNMLTSLTLHHGLWAKENRDNHISKSNMETGKQRCIVKASCSVSANIRQLK